MARQTFGQWIGERLRRMVFPSGGGHGRGIRFLMPGSQYDYERQAGDLWRNGAAAACLRWIKVNFPEPDLVVTRHKGKGHRDPNPHHPLVRLVDRPNPHYDRYALWGATALSLKVDGNAYWLKERSALGRVVRLWWVPHWMMEPAWDPDGNSFIDSYEYKVNGRCYAVDASEVVHFRDGGIDPHNDRKGLADLKAGCREVCADNDGAGYTAAILKNMGVPGVAIVPADANGRIEKPDADVMKATWRERFTGDERGTPFIPSGPVKIEKISLTPEEMALDVITRMPEARIAALLGMPPQVAGLHVGHLSKTHANWLEARRQAYEDCLMPLQRQCAETLTLQLLPDMGDPDRERVGWDYARVAAMREDEAAKAARACLAYKTGVAMRSESRTMIGLESTPADDVYFVQPGTVTAPGDPLGDERDIDTPPEDEEPLEKGDE